MEKNRYLLQLLDVIQVLRGSEVEIAKKHLKAYETNHTVNQRKMFQLYKCIKINDIHDYDKLKQKISPDSTDDSFNKLIRRTIDKVQESLTVDINIRRKNSYNNIFKKKYYYKKKLIEVEILINRGLVKRPNAILDFIYKDAKKYELYKELVEVLVLTQRLIRKSNMVTEFDEVSKEIEFFGECYIMHQRANSIQRRFFLIQNSAYSKENTIQELEINIEKIRQYSDYTKSMNIKSLELVLLMEYYYLKGNIQQEIDVGLKFIKILKDNVAIYSKQRIAIIYTSLSNSYLTIFKFRKSLELIKLSLMWIEKSSSLNFISAMDLKIKSQLLIGSDNTIEQDINELETNDLIRKIPTMLEKVKFYSAIKNFLDLDFKNAKRILYNLDEIKKDKEGWNVWIRVYRITIDIDEENLNGADYAIESHRKYIERIDKQNEVRERDKLVSKILQELNRQDYDFDLVAETKEEELIKLKSTNKEYAWNPDSPELILFHEWFAAKLENRPYEPNYKVYREASNN